MSLLKTPGQVGSRICLSASEYHQESWQPSWTVTSLVTALVAHMTEPAAEIGSVQGATPSQKRKAAARSRSFECAVCGCRHDSFPEGGFPRPKGFDVGRDVPPADARTRGDVDGGEDLRLGRGGLAKARSGVGGRAKAGSAALTGRSRLSWAVRLIGSKPFLLVLALILASVFLNRPS